MKKKYATPEVAKALEASGLKLRKSASGKRLLPVGSDLPKASPRRKHGRPKGSAYIHPWELQENIDRAYKIASKGGAKYIIATVLGLSPQAFHTWCTKSPAFVDAIKKGHGEFCERLLDIDEEITSGKADKALYPEVRRKAVESCMNRLFPEHTQKPYLIIAEEPTKPDTIAMKSFFSIQDMYDIKKPEHLAESENN